MINYKPQFIFPGDERQTNAQVFATYHEAYDSAQNRFMSWTMPTGFDVVETEKPVNYTFDAKKGDIAL